MPTPDAAFARMYEICDSTSLRAARGRQRIMEGLEQQLAPATFDAYGDAAFNSTLKVLKSSSVADMTAAIKTSDPVSQTTFAGKAQAIVNDMGLTPGPILQELLAALQQLLSTLLPQLLACLPVAA